jgi:hypothetical protein
VLLVNPILELYIARLVRKTLTGRLHLFEIPRIMLSVRYSVKRDSDCGKLVCSYTFESIAAFGGVSIDELTSGYFIQIDSLNTNQPEANRVRIAIPFAHVQPVNTTVSLPDYSDLGAVGL